MSNLRVETMKPPGRLSWAQDPGRFLTGARNADLLPVGLGLQPGCIPFPSFPGGPRAGPGRQAARVTAHV